MLAVPTLQSKCSSGKEAEHRLSEPFHPTAVTVTLNGCVACVIAALLFFQIILVVVVSPPPHSPAFSSAPSSSWLEFNWYSSLLRMEAGEWGMTALILHTHLADANCIVCVREEASSLNSKEMHCSNLWISLSYMKSSAAIFFTWVVWCTTVSDLHWTLGSNTVGQCSLPVRRSVRSDSTWPWRSKSVLLP